MHVVAQAPTQQDTLGLELDELSSRFDAKFIGVTIPGKDTPHGESVRMSLQEIIAPMFGSAFDSGVGFLDADKILGGTKWTDLTDGEDTILHKHDIYGELATAETVVGQWTFSSDILLTGAGTESIGSDAAGHVDIDAATSIDLNQDTLLPPSAGDPDYSYSLTFTNRAGSTVIDQGWNANILRIITTGYVSMGTGATTGGLAPGSLQLSGELNTTAGTFSGNIIGTADLTIRSPIFHVDANGVGCGTLNPSVPLHVYAGASGVTPYVLTRLIVDDDASAMVCIQTPNDKAGYYYFGDPERPAAAGILYSHATETLILVSDGVAMMGITAAGISLFGGIAGVDYTLTFNGETNDGVITWMEDEDYFTFSDSILMAAAEPIYFRDTALWIASLADGHLDVECDVSFDVNIGADPVLTVSANEVLIDNKLVVEGGTAPAIWFARALNTQFASMAFYTGATSAAANREWIWQLRSGDSHLHLYDDVANTIMLSYQTGAGCLVEGTHKWMFRDPQLYIASLADSYLDIIADGCVRINTNAWFEADGTRVASGAATTFDDLLLPFEGAHVPAANNPTWTAWLGNVSAYTFAVNDYLGLQAMELMHTYLEDSNFEFHVHWSTNGVEGAAKYVKWEIEYSIANSATSGAVGDTFPATIVISAETEIPASTPDRKNMYTTFTPVTGTNFTIGAILKVRVRRIASAGAAPLAAPFGLMAGIHVEQDTDGSRTQRAK